MENLIRFDSKGNVSKEFYEYALRCCNDGIEIWVDVKGYEGWYQVSNMGNVRSVDRNVRFSSGRVSFFAGVNLKIGTNGIGYLQTSLQKQGRRSMLVHRLVSINFIPNPGNLPESNHKDGVKINCKVNNLEWCTHSYNMKHSADQLGNYNNHPNKFKVGSLNWNSKKVLQFDINGLFIASFGSSTEAYRKTGIDFSSIQKVCSGIRKTAGGFIWKYE